MNRYLIVDDEAHCRNVLVNHLVDLKGKDVHLETANDVSEAAQKIEVFKPNIVLLDIRMNEGTGFDLLDAVATSKFSTIFTTAYNEYAIKAFEYSAVHYLLKPIDKKELLSALQRCKVKPQIITQAEKLKKLFISTETLELRANPADLCFIKAEGSYSKLHLTKSRTIFTSKNIGEYEESLPVEFFRVHKSFLVNLQHVSSIDTKNSVLITNCDSSIPISRRRKKEFFKRWENNN